MKALRIFNNLQENENSLNKLKENSNNLNMNNPNNKIQSKVIAEILNR